MDIRPVLKYSQHSKCWDPKQDFVNNWIQVNEYVLCLLCAMNTKGRKGFVCMFVRGGKRQRKRMTDTDE